MQWRIGSTRMRAARSCWRCLPTGLWCPLGKNPNGSCRGSGAVDAVDDAWDDTGGRAVTWVAENPGTAATLVAVGVCAGLTLGACGYATAGAYVFRAGERWAEDGFRDSLGTNLADGAITYATFGLVSAPASLGLTRGGGDAIPGLLGTGERGVMAGVPLWQSILARFLSAGPDLAGLAGGFLEGEC